MLDQVISVMYVLCVFLSFLFDYAENMQIKVMLRIPMSLVLLRHCKNWTPSENASSIIQDFVFLCRKIDS